MTIEPGTTLAHYEILSPLGKGGMGEVFRAKDTKLGREVAIKFLPEEFTRDPERLARFEREARVLASLDHSHIASIYGFEEFEGARFLVMQLADGEDLSDRLMRGPIPVEDAIDIARQIADGLEAAHDQGIVHRDLKPANIKINDEGKVTVLDFGLATALETEESDDDFSNSPTMIRAATQAGVILGTAAYMSPEQARGKKVDKRADIWAFGVVLWEMLTGRRLFRGETVSDTLASVLKEAPDFDLLPSATSPAVRRLLRRCLEKDPRSRLHDIADARLDLNDDTEAPAQGDVALVARKSSRLLAALPWAIAAIAIAFALMTWTSSRRDDVTAKTIVSKILPPDGVSYLVSSGFEISPDGTRIVFGGRDESGVVGIWIQSLEEGSARFIEGAEGGSRPFWSPDGESIGFFSNQKLKKIDLGTGVVETLADLPTNWRRPGGTWSRSGSILIASAGDLFKLPASGGSAESIHVNDRDCVEAIHPWFLPDGTNFLYLARNYCDSELTRDLRVASIDGSIDKSIVKSNSNAVLSPSGDLLWWQDGHLRAQKLDLQRLELVGESRVLMNEVQFDPASGMAMMSVSEDGTLVVREGGVVSGDELALVARDGSNRGTVGTAGNFFDPRLSPDGSLVAVDQSDETNRGDVWIYDVARGTGTRLTSAPPDETMPVWSPDGTQVAFESNLDGLSVRARTLRVSDNEQVLYESQQDRLSPTSWSASRRILISYGPATDANLGFYSLDDGTFTPYLASRFYEANGTFSPDGRMVAFDSDETGKTEVYIQTFPDPTDRWRVSTDGGTGPVWRSDGKELYYLNDESVIVAVKVTVSPNDGVVEIGEPEDLFPVEVKSITPRQFDTIDGQVFLLNRKVGEADATPLTLVINAFHQPAE